MTYQRFEELGTAPDYLWITEAMCAALGYTCPPMATARSQAHKPTQRIHKTKAPGEKREYASQYVGVTVRHGRWVAQWGPRGKTTCRVLSSAPEDEEAAAWIRAQALGRDYLEVRQ